MVAALFRRNADFRAGIVMSAPSCTHPKWSDFRTQSGKPILYVKRFHTEKTQNYTAVNRNLDECNLQARCGIAPPLPRKEKEMASARVQKKKPSLTGEVRALLAILASIARRAATQTPSTRKPKPSKA